MGITVDNILESISNPQGKFRTLDRIYAVGDRHGMPYHTMAEPFIRFLTVWDGRSHILLVPFGVGTAAEAGVMAKVGTGATAASGVSSEATVVDPVATITGSTATERMKNACVLVSRARSPYLVAHHYLESELTVFDNDGEPHLLDVVLAGNPRGRSLLDYARGRALAGDGKAVRAAFDAYIDFAVWMLGSGLTHGRIRNRNLRIDDNKIKLLDYRYLTGNRPGMEYSPAAEGTCDPEAGSSADDSSADADNLAAIALYLKALADDTKFILRINHLPPSVVARQLKESSFMAGITGRKELTDALGSLREAGEAVEVRNAGEAGKTGKTDKPVLFHDSETGESTLSSDGIAAVTGRNDGYDRIEPPREGIHIVERGGLLGFIDRDGRQIAPPVYQFATDFEGGMSVVVLDDHFGMIDTSGRYVLEPEYESIDWNAAEGVAQVSYDGRFGMMGDRGEMIVPPVYDWMSGINEGLVCVKRFGLYGYLDTAGNTVIEPSYTDAENFRSGMASVSLGGATFRINIKGEKI